MRWIFTLTFLWVGILGVPAQKMSGIWRGYFNSSVSLLGDMPGDVKYKFEIQLLQQKNAIKGVSYSYKTTVFYGKADITGIYTPGNKSLLLKETKLTDLKISGQSEACLMTCYLDYSSIGKMEFLDGTFFSLNIKDKSDCGSGKIHLEKVKESDFGKENFLIAQSGKPKTPNTAPAQAPNAKTDLPVAKPPVKGAPVTANAGGTARAPSTYPNTANAPRNLPETSAQMPRENQAREKENANAETNRKQTEPTTAKVTVPRVLLERENALVRTIITDQEDIRIDLYDNGTIDNDTITVYHNNQLVKANQRLSDFTPITFHINCNKNDNYHEIIVVAENLGDIPPNTALMVVTAGGKRRQEIFLASNEQKNAKVIIEFKPAKQ
jgi:hypothetical protein